LIVFFFCFDFFFFLRLGTLIILWFFKEVVFTKGSKWEKK
jgi:hypothetical protein